MGIINVLINIFKGCMLVAGILFALTIIYVIISTPFQQKRKKKELKQAEENIKKGLESLREAINTMAEQEDKPKRTRKTAKKKEEK